MVKVERSFPPPSSLAVEKEKKSGSYREKDVVLRLRDDFHGKCYLCNRGPLTDVNVEHLRPHHGGNDLKFNWENLFYSCPHCNSVKTKRKFDVILDCCKEDPEEVLKFSLSEGSRVSVTSQSSIEEVQATAELLSVIFNDNTTGCRSIASEERTKELLAEMNIFYKILKSYNKGDRKERNKKVLTELLHRKSPFAAFKRAYLQENQTHYKDLLGLLT